MQRPRWSLRRARALIGTKFLLIAGLVGFVLVAWLVELIVGLHEAVNLGPILAAAMAGIPAILWLGFFYLMDRHEPEPKQLVVGVCVLGGLIAAPLADFLQFQAVPPVALAVHGLSPFSLDRVLYAVLIVGLAQEMCKYAVVRYTIYMSREFDEPMDGIVYMMACGTGFAVWVNYHRLSGQNHEVYLSIGAAEAVVTTLAHASFAGLLGYVLGRAKFSRRSAPIRGTLLMLGLLGAAALNGQFTLVESWVVTRGLAQHPWYGVGYAAASAAAIFGLIWIVSQRLLAASPFREAGGVTGERSEPDEASSETASATPPGESPPAPAEAPPPGESPPAPAEAPPPPADAPPPPANAPPPPADASAPAEPSPTPSAEAPPPPTEIPVSPPAEAPPFPPADLPASSPPAAEAAASPVDAVSLPAVNFDEDGWPLDAAELVPAAGPPPLPVRRSQSMAAQTMAQMPSPAAAAYEAARLVGEMVGDIESAPGAALMAAAAAGAALEVARARVAAGELDRSLAAAESAADAASTDPATTSRLQRDRLLRALAEDIGASATTTAATESAEAAAAATSERANSQIRPALGDRAHSQIRPALGDRAHSQIRPAIGERAASQPGITARAASQPGLAGQPDIADDLTDDELDPVAIAAAAIARLRDRARTDLAELRVQYHRHDLLVIVVAVLMIIVTGRVYDHLVTPPTEPFEPSHDHGLTLARPKGWLSSPGDPPPAPRLAHEVTPSTGKPAGPLYRVELTSPIDPTARIEIGIDKKPAWSNIVTGLDLDRRTRWGELYSLDDSSVRSVEDHQWLRTAYRFAHAPEKGDVPRIDRAVEYATIDREQIYVITFFGSPGEIERAEELVAPSLRVATQTGLPLVPQTGHLSTRKYPNAVSRAFASTVMVVVADIVDGRLHARGGGSGVIVGRDGSILTNYHVIHDQRGRLHDVFVIGRFSEQDKAPQLFCAGKPSRSKLQRELDLALLKCDMDLDGRTWSPAGGAASWPTLPEAHAADVKMGQRIWVLGYPDVGGGGLTLSEGDVEGWSGGDGRGSPAPGSSDGRGSPAPGSAPGFNDGAAGKDFLKTDAAIRHGNSGGPVVDDLGRLVGIASAVRTKQNAAGDIVEIVQAGGRVRPIAAASDLLAIAAAGWTPREGHTDVELQPSAVEVSVEGVQIQSRVLDVVNEAPIRDALVMVLRPGINASTVDVNRLDDQVLAYGRSNTQGEVLLKQPVPVPGTYTLMVVARGYEPVIGEGELILDAKTPPIFDPWGKLLLRAR